MLPIIAIVGRPNVGKSTLFNRMVQENRALVDGQPGVTRDRIHGKAELLTRDVIVVDTGGIDTSPEEVFSAGILEHVTQAVADADVVVLLFDAITGLIPEDQEVLRRIQATGVPIVVAVNKCESYVREVAAAEFYALGIDHFVPIAAAHNRNLSDLFEAIEAHLPPLPEEAPEDEDTDRPLRVAVVGRPNAGKSTLVNRLLGEERCLVSDIPGTTRDAVDVEVTLGGQQVTLVDTAGLRRKKSIKEHIERSSVFMAIRAIERADLCLLVVDPVEGLTHQDAQIASLIEQRRRPAMVLVNKWDLLPREAREGREVVDQIRQGLRFLDYAPLVYVSALTGRGIHRIGPQLERVREAGAVRVPTAELNAWLAEAVERQQPPVYRRRIVRMPYITQVRVSPPSFVLFANFSDGVVENYQRYLKNRLRERFGYEGNPIVLHVRQKKRKQER
jgi:GTPase